MLTGGGVTVEVSFRVGGREIGARIQMRKGIFLPYLPLTWTSQ
jgi:hypothetical protein